MILGLGTDIVEIDRIARMIDRHGDAFLNRVFTPAERLYCDAKRHSAPHYAGRWAAKEAAMKALGTGFVPGVGWHDFEVLSLPSGAPRLNVSGGAARSAGERGITGWWISISHGRAHATATVLAEG